MKLFFTIFAAILCAAAVIWGVVSYRHEEDRKAKRRLDILTSMAETARITADGFLANENRKLRDIDKYAFGTAKEFSYFSSLPLPREANLVGLTFKFSDSYRQAIALARKNGGSDKGLLAWADQMEAELDEFFPKKK